MEMIPDPRTSPADLTVDTVWAWSLELTEVERRLGPRFARWDARRRVGAYLGAYSVQQNAKTGGNWPKSMAMSRPTGCSICWGAPCGMPKRCGTICEAM